MVIIELAHLCMGTDSYIGLFKPNEVGYIEIEVCIMTIACFGLLNEESVWPVLDL